MCPFTRATHFGVTLFLTTTAIWLAQSSLSGLEGVCVACGFGVRDGRLCKPEAPSWKFLARAGLVGLGKTFLVCPPKVWEVLETSPKVRQERGLLNVDPG